MRKSFAIDHKTRCGTLDSFRLLQWWPCFSWKECMLWMTVSKVW